MHGLVAASDCLTNVSHANPSAAIPSTEALRRLGQLRSRLEYSDMAQLMEHLDEEMVQVQDVSSAVTATVSTSFFAAADPTAWITEGRVEMRLSIEHKTGFRYSTKVKSSYNEARMTPVATTSQAVWGSRVSISPTAWSFSYPVTGAPP